MMNNELRHAGSFWAAAWECWHGASDRVCTGLGIGWNWYYAAFIGPEAVERYEAIGRLAMACAIWAYAQVKGWADEQVEGAIAEPVADGDGSVLTTVSTLALTYREWVLIVVLKAHATILQLRRLLQTYSNTLGGLRLQPDP